MMDEGTSHEREAAGKKQDTGDDLTSAPDEQNVEAINSSEMHDKGDDNRAETKSPDISSRGSLSNLGSFETSDDQVFDVTRSQIMGPSVLDFQAYEAFDMAKTVTPQRKEQLLLHARSDRLRWIQQVPLPYETKAKSTDRLSRLLQYSHASQQLPALATVLQHMYGHDTDRFDALLKKDDDEDVYLTGNQILAAEIGAATADPTSKPLLQTYQAFLNHLQDPACAVLVQGMRNFCRNFQEISDATTATSNLKVYIAATFKIVKQQAIFKGFDAGQLQRSLESFIFGHCRSHLESLLWTAEYAAKDDSFREKLQALQFVRATHLDIHCLAHQQDDVLMSLLAKPMAALQSVDSYHSVFEKLQLMLAIYRDVNTALTTALQRGENNEKLPSADDVLPTIILTVLLTKPKRLNLNLQLVEELSAPEYLRGEAGYAFTNVFGAFQFLQELDLEKEPASLTVSEADFRQAMADYRLVVKNRLKVLDKLTPDVVVSSMSTEEVNVPCVETTPSPLEIRHARMRGERVDLEWALQWQEKQGAGGCADRSVPLSGRQIVATEKAEQGLPPGFRRSYSFLSTRAEDIRVNDLPQLLEEYRMLVHTIEKLLGDRAVKAAAERKAKARAVENDLRSSARRFDPVLVPDTFH